MENLKVKKGTGIMSGELVLENEFLQLKINPVLGGKITSFVNKKTGTEFLHRTQTDNDHLKELTYGMDFQPPYSFGFDECFPTISPSRYQLNGSVIHFPDHGELWTQPWNVEKKDDRLILKTKGVQLNYEFIKELKLEGEKLLISYRLKNTGDKDFRYIWSSHPLLEIQYGDEILIPYDSDEMKIHWSNDKVNFKKGDTISWPGMDSSLQDLHLIKKENSGFAAKLFSNHLKNGTAGLYKKKQDESILFSFDADHIPFLGLWLCYNGWPVQSETKDYSVALEPTFARTDELDEAIKNGDARLIYKNESHQWNLNMSLINGKAEI